MKTRHPVTRARKLTWTAMLVAFLAVAGSLGLTAAAPAAAAPFCGITWGSLPKSGDRKDHRSRRSKTRLVLVHPSR